MSENKTKTFCPCCYASVAYILVGCSTGSQPAQNCEGLPVVAVLAYHKPFEYSNRLAVDHNSQTTRSTYPRTSTACSGTNKNCLNSFLVTKSFQLNSLIRN